MNKVKVNVALIRLFQFVIFVLFTFMVLAYTFALILLPLDAVVMLIKVLSIVGLGGIIGAIIAVPAVAYLGLQVYKIPGLTDLLIEIAVDLVNTGKARIDAFNKIIETVKA
ncbi:MAG: hypothetical protein PHQ03_01125 [Methylococcales bacterium]|nr:hypothetical protein [Methylococcales bacterium]